jgi:DNA-binding LytR/AlgR family response regulator
MKLSEALEKLPSQNFLRIHKCYVINLNKVEKIENRHVSISGKNLPVSDRYRKELMKTIIIKQ